MGLPNNYYGGLGPDFWSTKPLIGMIHLSALPGSAASERHGSAATDYLDRAIVDAEALVDGGVDALIVENFWDSPFAKDDVPPHTIAAMTRAVLAVRGAVSIPVGVNVLRNDARAAIAIAHVCGAQFVRVNVYVGAAVTDQGIIEGAARIAVLYRRELGADVAIFADIYVKHASQLGSVSLEDHARDAVLRGKADALIVSGAATGSPTSVDEIARIKSALPETPILIGSGLTAVNAPALMDRADGAIAGTSLKRDGIIANPVDIERVRHLRSVMGL